MAEKIFTGKQVYQQIKELYEADTTDNKSQYKTEFNNWVKALQKKHGDNGVKFDFEGYEFKPDTWVINTDTPFNAILGGLAVPANVTALESLASVLGSVNDKNNFHDEIDYYNEDKFNSKTDKDLEINYLDFRDLKFPNVDFSKAKFNQVVNFSETNFDKEVNFSEAQFHTGAWFKKANFKEKADFRQTKFHQEADFSEVQFHREASFREAKFNQILSFRNKFLKMGCNFNGAQFKKMVSFERAQFYYRIDFIMTIFKGEADFKKAKLYDKTYFKEVTFNKYTNFINWACRK